MTVPNGSLGVAVNGPVGALSIEAAFAAAAGETTAIFGPSGSGKTTVLRAVAGLTRLGGRITLNATIWQDDDRGIFLPPHRRRIGFAFQEPALFEHLTVEDNLRYPGRRIRAAEGDGAVSFSETVERLGLAAQLDRAPRRLSGGERQRVSLARALLADPRVLLLDEPLSALHRTARNEILPWLASLAARSGMIVLYVSHDVGEVVQIADRVALISGGSVSATATAAESLGGLEAGEVLSRFETGSLLMTRIRGHLPALGLSELELDGQTLRVPGARGGVGDPVRLRVRARDVALATAAPQAISIRNVLRGRIREITEHSGDPFAEVALDVGDQGLRARITRDAAAELGLGRGDEVFALLKTVSFDDA